MYVRHSGSRYATQTPPEQVHLSNMRLNGVHRSVVMLRISNVSPWLVAVWSGSLLCAPDHTHTGVGPARQHMSVCVYAPLMPLCITTTLAQHACHVMPTVRFARATQTMYIYDIYVCIDMYKVRFTCVTQTKHTHALGVRATTHTHAHVFSCVTHFAHRSQTPCDVRP